MAFFFNIETLNKYAAGKNDLDFVLMLRRARKSQKQGLVFSGTKEKQILSGTSFLANPDGIFGALVESAYVCQYIRLAALRNYADYTLYGRLTLDLTMYPELDTNRLQNNPLLKVVNRQLYFKYEN